MIDVEIGVLRGILPGESAKTGTKTRYGTGRMLKKIIRDSASYMLERFERDADYPSIDTKFNIVSGRDFGHRDEDFRQRDFIYGWIQGRGMMWQITSEKIAHILKEAA